MALPRSGAPSNQLQPEDQGHVLPGSDWKIINDVSSMKIPSNQKKTLEEIPSLLTSHSTLSVPFP